MYDLFLANMLCYLAFHLYFKSLKEKDEQVDQTIVRTDPLIRTTY